MAHRASSFFTPPRLEPVRLRLADLGGGGSFPTQFEGHTTDGHAVYVRYRGGGLTIHVASAPGRSAFDGGECLLDVHLGPAYDGYISLAQFLRLTGLSVPNTSQSDDPEGELDLSGQTTFWSAVSLPTTLEGAKALVHALRQIVPDLEELHFSDALSRRAKLASGASPTATILEFCPGGGLPKLVLNYSRFMYDFPGYGAPNADEDLSEKLGSAVSVAGSRSCDLKLDNLSVSADFPTSDHAARAFLDRVSRVMDAHYPLADYAEFDLATGERVSEKNEYWPEDPRVGDWILAEPGRYRYIRWDCETGKYYGKRRV